MSPTTLEDVGRGGVAGEAISRAGREGAAVDVASVVDGPLIEEMVAKARRQGLALSGPHRLLAAVTKRVLPSALEGDITDHLGYDKRDRAERGAACRPPDKQFHWVALRRGLTRAR